MVKRLEKPYPKRHLKLWITIFVVWFGIFAIALASFGLDESLREFFKLDVVYLSLSIFTFALSIGVSILDWALLAGLLEIKFKLRNLSKIMLAGLFVDNILPNVTPTGELTMGYLLHKKENASLPKSLASIVAYMISWFFGFILFALLVLVSLLFLQTIPMEGVVLIAVLIIPFVIILLTLIYITINAELCERIVVSSIRKLFKYILRFSRFKGKQRGAVRWARQTIKSFNKVFKIHFKKKSTIFIPCLWMTFHHFLMASSFYFMVLAFGGNMTFVAAAGVFVTLSLITMLSMVPGQIGVYEILAISILSSLGVGLVDSAMITNLVRLVQYWSIIFIGGFFAIKLGVESITFKKELGG